MSKKLIAVASAAAIALSALVATPAVAGGTWELVAAPDGAAGGNGSSAALATTHKSLEENVLSYSAAAGSNNVVRYQVSATNGRAIDSVAVTTAGGVKVVVDLVDAAGKAVTTAAGQASLTAPMVGGKYTFYAFTTSTTAGSVTITSNGNASTYHVASQVGPQYNIAATFPTALVPDGAAKVVVKLTDVFGNEIDNSNSNATDRYVGNVFNNASLTVTRIGATASDTAWRYDATDKGWVLLSKDVKTGEVALRVDLLNVTDRKVGFAAPITSAFKMISTASLEAQITSLTAQVATLTASVTALTADYNRLATRFNKRYDLQKAPVKKVALK